MADRTFERTDPPRRGEIEIDEQEVDRRKQFLDFRKADEEALKSLGPIAQQYADQVIEDLYRHLLSFEETRVFFSDPQVLERVKRLQKEYFVGLTQGDYGADYVRNRLRIGVVHERINLAPKWYLGAYSFYLQAVAHQLPEAFGNDPPKAFAVRDALIKLIFMDIGLAIDSYISARDTTVRKQQEAIRELSTPVLQIRDRLLLLPLIGVIDTHRARLVTEGLLRAIRANRARVVVMDVTGVATIDSKVANHLLQTIAAARLMGASVIVTGLSSDVAQSLVTLGIDLGTFNAVGDLQGGIEEAERLLGYRLVRAGETGNAPHPA